jgi:hypothetical protein
MNDNARNHEREGYSYICFVLLKMGDSDAQNM